MWTISKLARLLSKSLPTGRRGYQAYPHFRLVRSHYLSDQSSSYFRNHYCYSPDFGDSDITSAGEVINLEPQPSKNASLAVITSTPDSASITLDGTPLGFTPILIPQVQAGDHQIVISSPVLPPHHLRQNRRGLQAQPQRQACFSRFTLRTTKSVGKRVPRHPFSRSIKTIC